MLTYCTKCISNLISQYPNMAYQKQSNNAVMCARKYLFAKISLPTLCKWAFYIKNTSKTASPLTNLLIELALSSDKCEI